jgi:ribose transport system permease protein
VKPAELKSTLLRSPIAHAVVPLCLVLLIGCLYHQNGAFFQWETHRAVLRELSAVGILACGMTLVIITAGIDLSVGSILGLCAVSFALFTMPLGLGAGSAIALVLLIGSAAGAVSGLFVARARIQPFVVTLAMMVFARGLAKQLSDGKKVTNTFIGPDGAVRTSDLPAIYGAIDAKILGENLSIVSLVFAACALVTYVVLDRLRLGRQLYAVGGNAEAARLAGVPVKSTLVMAYALSGLFAAIAGICQAAQETHGDPETGAGYELEAIAMVVLGGTSLMGGRGGIGRTLIGVLTLGYLHKVLSLNAFSTEARLMLTGVIIVLAVIFQQQMRRREA